MSIYCVEVKTVQASAIKILIEALKELLTETCIEFDDSGIKIIAMDTAHVVLVHLKLEASKFEYYHCPKRHTIGVNMLNLHKLIKTINSNDSLTFFIDESDQNHLGIKIENSEKATRTTYKLNLYDLDNPQIKVDPAEFNSVITLQSSDFHKICRDMNNLADMVEIRNINNQLIFKCSGEFAQQETIISDNDNGSTITTKNANEIVQGVFNLKYLIMFTKCTNLCNVVELYLKNDYPLICAYNVASLGTLRLCLAPNAMES
jgi:proliferating cell nuclear antigen